MKREFNLKQKRRKLFEQELLGKITSAGRIHRKIIRDDEEYINIIKEWCWANNTIPMKEMFKDMEQSKLKLATTDGGYVNVIELIKFMDEKAGDKLI